MSPHRRLRLPISTRHAFALAFDLAFRRDPLHSLLVPALLRAPWLVAMALLPEPTFAEEPGRVFGLTVVALLGDFVTSKVIEAMMRFRARSVFNTPLEVRPGGIGGHYALGLGRLLWLIVTEIVRNLGILFAGFFFFVPGIYLGFRLSFATEAVVLNEPHTEGAFRRSFRLTPGRFERWFEMALASVGLVLAVYLFITAMWAFVQSVPFVQWTRYAYILSTVLLLPVIQYAWTFFYLRLVEVDVVVPDGVEPGPLYAGTPSQADPAPFESGATLVPAGSPQATPPQV